MVRFPYCQVKINVMGKSYRVREHSARRRDKKTRRFHTLPTAPHHPAGADAPGGPDAGHETGFNERAPFGSRS